MRGLVEPESDLKKIYIQLRENYIETLRMKRGNKEENFGHKNIFNTLHSAFEQKLNDTSTQQLSN